MGTLPIFVDKAIHRADWGHRIEPPLVVCVASNADHSFAALRATKECVIAIPALELAPKRYLSGTFACAAVSTCAEGEV